MDQQQLKNILELHRKWVMSEPDGERADLSYADLRSANLHYANLRDANLSYANLSYANLSYANLRSANLHSADLRSANLHSANLHSADLSYANLRDANLRDANLRDANLRDANLRDANLHSAKVEEIKKDFFKRLDLAKDEAIGLYDALIRGKIDGSHYEGECACFCGTVANLRKENYQSLTIDLRPDADSATERWFMGISKGDTGANNQLSAMTQDWMLEWFKEHEIKFPEYKLISSFDCPELFK